MKKFSFFEVPSDFEKIILKELKNAVWNGNKIRVEKSQVPKNQPKQKNNLEKNQAKKPKSKSIKNKKNKQNKSSFKARFKTALKRK